MVKKHCTEFCSFNCVSRSNYWLFFAGPKAPKDPDVCMAPLIEDCVALFVDGVPTIDASYPLGDPLREFKLSVLILWTDTDWPGLGSCSGLKTSGYCACHKCGNGLRGRHSKSLSKIVYHEHRTWLPADDPMRNAGRTHWLSSERKTRPIGPSPQEWQEWWDKVTRRELTKTKACINRWSALYQLPYWKVSLIRSS